MKKKSSNRNPYIGVFLKVFIITVCVGVFLVAGVFIGAVAGIFGNLDGIDIESLTMDYSTQIFYKDSDGNEQFLTTISSEQNRVWVDYEHIPQNLKDAMVAIEDERFYSHNGFDFWRTSKAFFAFVGNKITGKPTTFGGSTITQQLIKNLTRDDDRTAARKIQEISRAVQLEKQLSKEQILELYLNSIYLSNGCNGVQTASHKFFGKPVSELDLAECACIAGITQYPSLYDPLQHPEKNKEKQEIVLKKMLDLGYIDDTEYETAVNQTLVFTESNDDVTESGVINSYFVDQIIFDIKGDLIEKGYSDTLATKMIYSGGLKITATVDPKIQEAMEGVFEDTSNFPNSTDATPVQSSMVVIDPYTGEIKGVVGGIGKKTGNLVLNRATRTLRQPGSTIKPIAVYAPAIEENLISPASIYSDKAISYGNWSPKNYDHTFKGDVSVRYAVRRSLNTIPVQILNELGPEKSFYFMTNNLGVTSLVNKQTDSSGKVFSDIGLSQLALGGLTHGISPLELTAAYSPFVNQGLYIKPYSYTRVLDHSGNELLSNYSEPTIAMSESTAYIMSMMLREVVTSGTGGGSQLPSGIFTAGKTGTTSDNHDRWFVGYTPYYVATVWYGYDTPQPIRASGNPCIPVWKKVMTEIHASLPNKTPTAPSNVKYVEYCGGTGNLPGKYCEDVLSSFWFTPDNMPTRPCTYSHGIEDDTPVIQIELPDDDTLSETE